MLTCPTCHHQYPTSEQFCSRDGAILLAPDGAAADATIGQLLPGGHRIEERLGEGGMGIVYRATRSSDQQPFAVKILRAEYTQNQDILNRFYQEAQAVSQLQHPNIAKMIETGALRDGRPYLLLEYLRGYDLATVLREQGALPEAEAIDIALQATEALQAAHQAGIIHRDLKPDNLFLCENTDQAPTHSTFANTETSNVKILDFGLAKLLKKSTDEAPLSREEARTRSGVIMGTPYYMSPEQACGKPVDEQTDVYALGVILYEMLTGRVPFRSPDGPLHVLMQHLNEPPTAPSELQSGLSKEIDLLVLHCLAKEKPQRYTSMAELRRDLLSLQRGAPLSFKPPKRKTHHTPTLLLLSFAGLVVLVGSYFALTQRGTPPTQPTPPVSLAVQPASAPTSTQTAPTIVTLSIETTPPGAQILLDEQPQPNNTPTTLKLTARETAQLKLRKEGYEDLSQPVSLSSSLVLKLNLTKLKKKGNNPKETTPPDQMDPYKKKGTGNRERGTGRK